MERDPPLCATHVVYKILLLGLGTLQNTVVVSKDSVMSLFTL